ncbi:MAG: hypothetical protein JHC33_04935 [Ignisphaera sp.]|nr:hypothetical protein [Ignisphaera sp.]
MTNEELMSMAAEMSQNGGGNYGEATEPQEQEETKATEGQETPAEQHAEPVEAPIETPQAEAQEPQVDTKHEELLAKLADMEAQLKMHQAPQVQEAEPSEEDMAMAELKKRLGFDELHSKLSDAMQVIEQMKAREATTQHEHEVESAINKFKQEYPNITEDKLVQFIKSQPPERTALYSSPVGWRMAADHMNAISKPNATPDPITPSQSPVNSEKDSFSRLKSGEDVSRIDIGKMILGMSKH